MSIKPTCLLEQMFLMSDRATFTKSAKKSRHNDVCFAREPSHLAEWKILPYDPKFRMELELTPVPVSKFSHYYTDFQNECILPQISIGISVSLSSW